jgi:ABC-type transport system involved in cytochrome bd biosynthesis fused ATPase/permease subunit
MRRRLTRLYKRLANPVSIMTIIILAMLSIAAGIDVESGWSALFLFLLLLVLFIPVWWGESQE